MPMPRTSCSGMPSRNAPSASAEPAPLCRRHQPVGDEVGARADREPDAHHARVTDLRAFLGQVKAHRADQRAGTEREDQADDPVGPWAHEADDRTDHQ